MRNLLFAFFLLLPFNAFSQKVSYSSLYGHWNVIDVSYFIRISPQDEDGFIKEKNRCLRASCTIDKNGIHIIRNACDFTGCPAGTLGKADTANIILTSESFTSMDEDFNITDSTVTDKFIALMDKRYRQKEILFYKTECLVDWGDATLKIFVINKNKIALYLEWSVVVLERKK